MLSVLSEILAGKEKAVALKNSALKCPYTLAIYMET